MLYSAQFLYALGGVFLISLISLVGLFTLTLSTSLLRRAIFILVSISVGALFGDAFLHLLPELLEEGMTAISVGIVLFSGILLFFILEKFLRWHHSHAHGEIDSEHPKENVSHLGTVVLVGDGVHNFIDGIIIGASFLVDSQIGFATLGAIALHEIPQEIGDFGVLIHAGYTRKKALLFNFLSALLAVVGVITAFFVGKGAESFLYYMLAFAAGGFIYIAGSDLVPELHKTRDTGKSALQILSIIAGFAIMLILALAE